MFCVGRTLFLVPERNFEEKEKIFKKMSTRDEESIRLLSFRSLIVRKVKQACFVASQFIN